MSSEEKGDSDGPDVNELIDLHPMACAMKQSGADMDDLLGLHWSLLLPFIERECWQDQSSW